MHGHTPSVTDASKPNTHIKNYRLQVSASLLELPIKTAVHSSIYTLTTTQKPKIQVFWEVEPRQLANIC